LSRIEPVIDELGAALAPVGLNLIGVAAADAVGRGVLERFLPGAASAIVIGNGGGAFWRAFVAEQRDEPEPLDAFTRRMIEERAVPVVTRACGTPCVVYPFAPPDETLPFMRLAACAGLGRPSLLGVLVHPVYGPWIALRAALLVPVALTAPRPAADFDPCPGCRERPCVAACPAGAVSAAGWDVPRCAAYRAQPDDPCAARCHARFDCVIGREHRYPAAALAHHQGRVRPLLLGVAR
jgi:hypothetical protein